MKENETVEQQLLTEEEYAKRQRAKTRAAINRITRVFGLGAIICICISGIFDILFELSWFGWLWDKIAKTNVFDEVWNYLEMNRIYDDIFYFNTWLPQLGMTVVLLAAGLALVYLVAYSIADIIDVIRGFKNATSAVFHDFAGVVTNDTKKKRRGRKPGKPKKEEPAKVETTIPPLFAEEPTTEVAPKRRAGRPRRKEPEPELNGLSSEDLDKLLSGEMIDSSNSVNNF